MSLLIWCLKCFPSIYKKSSYRLYSVSNNNEILHVKLRIIWTSLNFVQVVYIQHPLAEVFDPHLDSILVVGRLNEFQCRSRHVALILLFLALFFSIFSVLHLWKSVMYRNHCILQNLYTILSRITLEWKKNKNHRRASL